MRILRWAVLALAAVTAAPAAAAEQTLVYDILKDGEPIGEETVVIRRAGGRTDVAVATRTDVTMLFLKFRYRHQRQETWVDGRLTEMRADTDDDGTRHTLAATWDKGGASVTVDGAARTAPAESLPLTLWTPEVVKPATLLSVIDGEAWRVRTKDMGAEQIRAGGRLQPARHWRIEGDVVRDLWYAPDGTLLKIAFERRGFPIEYVLR
jgi:hypothetical protein